MTNTKLSEGITYASPSPLTAQVYSSPTCKVHRFNLRNHILAGSELSESGSIGDVFENNYGEF